MRCIELFLCMYFMFPFEKNHTQRPQHYSTKTHFIFLYSILFVRLKFHEFTK
jgi:hypothetical protein